MNAKLQATIEAVENANRWMNGAVVVAEENGDFTAIPGAYLSDASYGGSTDIVLSLENGLDGTGCDFSEMSAEEIAEFLLENE